MLPWNQNFLQFCGKSIDVSLKLQIINYVKIRSMDTVLQYFHNSGWKMIKINSCMIWFKSILVVKFLVNSFYSRSNGLVNFRSNGLQFVALMSVLFRSFVLSIRLNVFRR